MDNKNRLLTNIVVVLSVSLFGAILMTGLDPGGTRWVKFILYVIFFASLSSPAFFSSRNSCSIMQRRLRKRS